MNTVHDPSVHSAHSTARPLDAAATTPVSMASTLLVKSTESNMMPDDWSLDQLDDSESFSAEEFRSVRASTEIIHYDRVSAMSLASQPSLEDTDPIMMPNDQLDIPDYLSAAEPQSNSASTQVPQHDPASTIAIPFLYAVTAPPVSLTRMLSVENLRACGLDIPAHDDDAPHSRLMRYLTPTALATFLRFLLTRYTLNLVPDICWTADYA